MEEPEQPPMSGRHGRKTPAHPRPSDDGEAAHATDERTSPSPYAEKFDEWVDAETAAPEGDCRDRGTRDVRGSRAGCDSCR